jgi:hypothetical protein
MESSKEQDSSTLLTRAGTGRKSKGNLMKARSSIAVNSETQPMGEFLNGIPEESKNEN